MKKLISAVLAAIITLSAVTASAKEWVRVSAWAYNDVSVFANEGLLTPAFENLSNYTKNITRGQFAELICSVLVKTGNESFEWMPKSMYKMYDDIGDNKYYQLAVVNNIVRGEEVSRGTDEYGNERVTLAHFHPDREITREDAAVIMQRALWRCSGIGESDQHSLMFSDNDDISDYATEAVAALCDSRIMNGVGSNRFNPKGNMTIEQAMTALYKLYRYIPSVAKPDGDGIAASTETEIQKYENGAVETKLNNMLYIKKDGISFAFETDVYSNIICVTNNGSVLAAAQTHKDTTDVFNIKTQELLFTIPCNMYTADNEYIYTKSSRMGLMKFGLYDYSGKEILKAEYSLAEIDKLKANGFTMEKESYRAPDGWIYYADWADNGHMYRVDSNGENKEKISDEDCYDFKYIDGWIYYHIRGEKEGSMFCMKPDGSKVTQLTIGRCSYVDTQFLYDSDGKKISENDPVNKPFLMVIDDLTVDSEVEVIRRLYKVTHENGDTQIKQITDLNVSYIGESIQDKETGKMWGYFVNSDPSEKSPLYRTDGEVVECVNEDVKMSGFQFMQNKDGEMLIYAYGDFKAFDDEPYHGGDWQMQKVYDLNMNYIEEYDKEKVTYSFPEEYNQGESDSDTRMQENVSDDKYSVYYYSHYDEETNCFESELYYTDSMGNKTVLENMNYPMRRYGDTLYSLSADGHSIISYDMNTMEYKTIAENISGNYLSNFEENNDYNKTFGTVADRNGNIWKCDFAKGGEMSEVYPNSNTKRYGEVYSLSTNERDKTIIKLDTGGNYCDILTGIYPKYVIYVADGAEESADVDWDTLVNRHSGIVIMHRTYDLYNTD